MSCYTTDEKKISFLVSISKKISNTEKGIELKLVLLFLSERENFSMIPRLASSLWSSCLGLLGPVTTSVCHHSGPHKIFASCFSDHTNDMANIRERGE